MSNSISTIEHSSYNGPVVISPENAAVINAGAILCSFSLHAAVLSRSRFRPIPLQERSDLRDLSPFSSSPSPSSSSSFSLSPSSSPDDYSHPQLSLSWTRSPSILRRVRPRGVRAGSSTTSLSLNRATPIRFTLEPLFLKFAFTIDLSTYLDNPALLFEINRAWKQSAVYLRDQMIQRALIYNQSILEHRKERTKFLEDLTLDFSLTLVKARKIANDNLNALKLSSFRKELFEKFEIKGRFCFQPKTEAEKMFFVFRKVNFLTQIVFPNELIITPEEELSIERRTLQKMKFEYSVDSLRKFFHIEAIQTFPLKIMTHTPLINEKIKFYDLDLMNYNKKIVCWAKENNINSCIKEAFNRYQELIDLWSGVGRPFVYDSNRLIDIDHLSYAIFVFADLVLRNNQPLPTSRIDDKSKQDESNSKHMVYENYKLRVLQFTVDKLTYLTAENEIVKLTYILDVLQKNILSLKNERIDYIRQTLRRDENAEEIYLQNLCTICSIIWPGLNKAIIMGEFYDKSLESE